MKKKQLVSFGLAAVMGLSLVACGGSKKAESNTESASQKEAAYTAESTEIYNATLSEFKTAYDEALAAEDVNQRYALMAVAEAKLMESAVMLPTSTRGGRYQVGNVAPYTGDYTLWGNDNYRYHQRLITTETIKSDDYQAMVDEWNKVRGTGKYASWAKKFLKDKGYKIKDSFTLPYTSDPVTWDVLATSLAADSEAIINTYDGLMEYDEEGTLQPALAESYEVSDDGLTYTFHLRKGLKWVDSQGREVADVCADDFVAGMQHMMDATGGLEYLVEGIIKNASQYISGEVTDFAEVGVAATDDTTVVYTLEAPCSYFTTMLGYGVFAPMSRTYYESQGGKFGTEYNNGDSDYAYGKDADHIAYCGPYLVTSTTAKNSIVFKANDAYWNAKGINVKTITWTFDDGSDPNKQYNDYKAGTVDYVNLTTATIETAKKDGLFDSVHVTDTDATSYMGFYNLNRAAFADTNDDTTVISKQTDEDKERTNKAMNNVHFRRAISFAVDRASYNAQQVGDDLKYASMRNSYVPGTFVQLTEDTTISINGTDTTFKAGTFFGEIEQAQIDADGVTIKVWDKDANNGAGSSDGFDGWYNPENAVAELNTAISELEKDGVTIDEKNPIVIDLPYASNDEVYTNKANAYKKSLEESLGGKVQISLVACSSYDEWYYAGYYTEKGYESNYDIYDLSGWGPDYGDPQTYLDTFLPDYAGYMIRCIGIF